MIYFKKRLVLIFVLGFLLQTYAQEKQRYNGPLAIDGYVGQAAFTYYVAEQDTIYDGIFQLQSSNLGALLEKEDTSFLIEGNFSKGTPNGPWQFQFGEFQSESESKLVGYEYRVLISGRQEEAKGNLQNGKPDGKWSYEINRIKSSEIESTLFKSVINFNNGIPQQNFQIENDSTVLVGRFLRNGLAHDEWTSYAANAIEDTENWFFNEGLLEKITWFTNGLLNEVPVFGSSAAYKNIPLDQGYIALLKANLAMNNTTQLQSGVIAVLEENQSYYDKLNGILNKMSPSDFTPNMQVRVPFYPLDSVQKKELERIAEDVKAAKVISDTLLNNSHLNIVRRSDKDAQYRFQVAKKIQKDFLVPLNQLTDLKDKDILEYISFPKLVGRLWSMGKPNTAVVVSVDNSQVTKTFELPNASDYNFEGNTTKAVASMAEYARLGLQDIMESLSDRLTNEARLQALNGLEKDLIAENDSLVSQIDTLLPTLPETYKAPLGKLKTLAESSLSEYAALKNPEEKLAYGNKLKVCLEELRSLADVLGHLPQTASEIEILYQDAIWNPFMATVMQEGVKKRLLAAYTEQLIPYFLSNANNTDCEGVKPLTQEMVHTHDRMVKLREADTKKLERKLRKQKDPKEIMKLLHEQITAKEE